MRSEEEVLTLVMTHMSAACKLQWNVTDRLRVSACNGLESGRWEDVYEALHCPITLEIFRDPVVAWDGQTYDRSAISEWFKGHDTSPLTNMVVDTKALHPNHFIRVLLNLPEEEILESKTSCFWCLWKNKILDKSR